jgi:hypothetical protein
LTFPAPSSTTGGDFKEDFSKVLIHFRDHYADKLIHEYFYAYFDIDYDLVLNCHSKSDSTGEISN